MSANSGEEIYNRVIVEAQGPDGSPLRVERWSPPVLDMSGFAQPANPSADVNVANWTATGALTRDTGAAQSSPASFLLGASIVATSAAVTQALKRGRRYAVRVWLDDVSAIDPVIISVIDGSTATTYATKTVRETIVAFTEFTLDWTQPVDATGYRIVINNTALGDTIRFDTITVGAMKSTVVDRRGFRRTKVLAIQSALTQAGAAQIGDTYLSNHKATPFKGSLNVTGQGGVRRVLGGAAVHPAHLLRETGEFIRFSHRIDPDTGHHGREGRIASVTYNHDTETASVQIDNERNNFEALLTRLGALTSAG